MNEEDQVNILALQYLIQSRINKLEENEFINFVTRKDNNIIIKYNTGTEVWIDISPIIIEGKQGEKGRDGLDGRDGKDGLDGNNGIDGVDGRDGIDGRDGKNGKNGVDGRDGATGKDGAPGIDGKNGVDGRDGAPGKDGNGITNIKINDAGQLIITTDDKVYNLGVIKFFGGGGGSSSNQLEFTYTNSLPMPTAVGGFPAGTTFDKMPLTELWTKLLYSYEDPMFTSFIIASMPVEIEVGDTIAAGTKEVSWNIDHTEMLKPSSIFIKYENTATILVSGLDNLSPIDLAFPAISYNEPTTVIFTINALTTLDDTLLKPFYINFMHNIYYGESTLETLASADILDLRVMQLQQNINGTYNMQTGGYKWFCFPVAMGERNNFVDVNTGFKIAMNPYSIVSITRFGIETDYYCYRSFNILGGEITVRIN